MKEKTNIRHYYKNDVCPETLDKEFWGNDDYRMTCSKCGFSKLIKFVELVEIKKNNEILENYQKI